MIRALVLRAPGINRDHDAAYACRLAGFTVDLVHINQLRKAPDTLLDYQFLLIPGGFSYGDDLGAGHLLAKNLTIHLGPQLQRFIDEGRPVLGVCNGFQVLVRAGLLPGLISEDHTRAVATLTENQSAQFECRWITMAVQPSVSIFTRGIERPIESPVAHGEGQFVLAGDIAQLQSRGQVALVYATSGGQSSHELVYPANPNGSLGNIAGVCNERGNVMGMMPHPENYVTALQHPQRRGFSNGQGDGLLIFKNAYEYARQLQQSQEIRQSQEIQQSQGLRQPQGLSLQGVTPVTPNTTNVANTNDASKTASAPTNDAAISYASSGVDVAAGEQAVRLMQKAVRATHGQEVLAGVGAFAGLFSAGGLQKMQQPVLAATTDGVGTKTLIAAQAGRYDTIGYDIVNHCINDLLCQGARPLFFMDYLAMGKLDPLQAAAIVESVAQACRDAGCALLGGETAEMPDVYHTGAFDLAGTMVGAVDQADTITGSTISAGDVLLGLPSSGLHTNGYSLARRVFAQYSLETVFPELGESLVDALLRPHRSYLREFLQLHRYLADRGRFIKGIAHITGGGFEGNISRILPGGVQAEIDTESWEVPPLFKLIARLGNVSKEECYRALNMGVGLVLVLSPKAALEARSVLPRVFTIGKITEGEGVIVK